MNITIIANLLLLLLCFQLSSNLNFNLSQTDKHGQVLQHTTCNKDTVIDFSFSPQSTFSGDKLQQSTLHFLDASGSELDYTLQNVIFNNNLTISQTQVNSYVFTFTSSSKKVYVVVPTLTQKSNTNTQIDLKKLAEIDSNFWGFSQFQNSQNSLNAFNFLNLRDYGLFYTSVNGSNTILISKWIYYNGSANTPGSSDPFGGETFEDYANTADLICYGSSQIFQTHLRQSWPLWTIWFCIFFYWIYLLMTEDNTLQCFDKEFEENKWTCWGFYSLFFLGNEQFFTKQSRTTVLLVSFSAQACILAAMYGSIGSKFDATTIIWMSVVALVVSQPLAYILGGVFLQSIYEKTKHKFQTIKKLKGMFNKQQAQNYQQQVDKDEQVLYGLYYWFYVLSFAIFITSWVIGIYMMQQTSREQYYLHGYWLSSLAITFVLDNLILNPILTVSLGNLTLYRIRGFYYDYQLGQQYKNVQL